MPKAKKTTSKKIIRKKEPKTFYITTTLPYVNAEPHIGFAAEIVRADIIARYQRTLGKEVFFNTGTDEHGQKIYNKALENNKDPQVYVDEYAAKFELLDDTLNLSYNSFIRTTNLDHIKAAQEFWKLCDKNGDIYKKNYKIKYCVGCELEKSDSELVDGCCPLHPKQKLELINEENYFFAFSKYQKKLLDLYEKNLDFVIPEHRLHEIKNFVAFGLQDFSISRLKSKMPWGVPVPGDKDHVMYVWFDALVNYISCLGWPKDKKHFKKFWPGVQVAGKDNLRQQTAMWQAMLMSAGLPNSQHVLIFGFINSGGQKMSKSLGNVINPVELVQKYGTDAVRYFLVAGLTAYEDSDFTYERFEEKYNSDLANEFGNLISRVLAMTEKYYGGIVPRYNVDSDKFFQFDLQTDWEQYDFFMKNFKLEEALNVAWEDIRRCNAYIDKNRPWELAANNDDEILPDVIFNLLETIRQIAWMILPFMPQTSEKILVQLGFDFEKEMAKGIEALRQWGGLKLGQKINKGESLFPRL
jgi:methionyl-tRNA synthetase